MPSHAFRDPGYRRADRRHPGGSSPGPDAPSPGRARWHQLAAIPLTGPARRPDQAGGPGRPRRRRRVVRAVRVVRWSGWRVRVTASARRNGPPAGQDRPEDPATADERIEISADATIAVCCSGGGVRSATFNLGALQALQAKPEVFDRVTTVTAVAGGSFIAAAHALVTARSPRAAGPAAKGLDPPAYALQSPEEQHLRDHTRYMVETWQLAVRCLAVAIRGS